MKACTTFMKTERGFTLIELLIVLAILSLGSLFAFINLGSFREDKELQNASGALVSFLRLAQTNATSGVKCGTNSGAYWAVEFRASNRENSYLICQTPPLATPPDQRWWSLGENIIIKSIEGKEDCLSSFTSLSTSTGIIKVQFSPIYGKVEFIDANVTNTCLAQSQNTVITLENTQTGGVKQVTVGKGGIISVKQ